MSAAARSSGFAPALVVTVAVAGFLGFLAFVGLGAYEPQFRTGNDGGAHAMSKSAVGFSGLVQLLTASGRHAAIARGEARPAPSDTPGVVVLTLPMFGDPSTDLRDLPTTRGFDGSVLVVPPKWMTTPDRHKGWVRKYEPDSHSPIDTWLGPTHGKTKIELTTWKGVQKHRLHFSETGREAFDLQTGSIDRLQVFKAAPGWTPLLTDESGHIVMAYKEDGDIYALSDPDLLNNQGIADLTAARTAIALIDETALDGPVYFDVTLAGMAKSRSTVKLLLEPPFLSATICALGAALMMIWHAAFGFGAPRIGSGGAFALGKRALADNQAGLIRMARREHRMGGRYAQLIAGLTAKAVGAPRELAGEALVKFLDRLAEGGRAGHKLSTLREAAEGARDRAQLMSAAEGLYRWKLEMTRETN